MARLQKQDLAKQFEDIVKQEIKNHNDAIARTNTSINELRSQLESQRKEFLYKFTLVAEESQSRNAKVFDLERDHCALQKRTEMRINDLIALQKSEFEKVKSILDTRESYFLTVSDFDQFKVKIDEWMAQIRRLFEVHQSVLSQGISKASESHIKPIEEMENKWRSRLKETIDDVADLNRALDVFGVNFDGLKREIEMLKKRCFIIEKNIENLYTQIDRVRADK